MAPILRPATRDDRAAVREIVRAAFTPYRARSGRDPGPMRDDDEAPIRQGRVHAAVRDRTVEGILVLIPQDVAMRLDNVAVAPGAQGSGLGRAMLAFAERAAIAAGYGSILLYTNAAMTENIGLYARLGYAETHRIAENGFRRVYMRKPLAGQRERV